MENQLPKELPVRRDCAQQDKPDPVFLGGVDPDQYDHITRDHWYAMCLRQSLQYGPKFQMVSKYAVDRSWCDLRCRTSTSFTTSTLISYPFLLIPSSSKIIKLLLCEYHRSLLTMKYLNCQLIY